MALALLSYQQWVRGSWIGALLNGRRLGPAVSGPRRSSELSATGLASAAGGQ